MITVRHSADLDPETIESVAFGGQPLRLHPELLEELRRSHAEMEGALADGRRVYGVNTGMGYLAGKGLRGLEREKHQRNLLVGRAVGSPPFLPAQEVRALLAARLINLTSPHTGATPELCGFVVDRLNDGFVPAVPRGGVGCAGEVIPSRTPSRPLSGLVRSSGQTGWRATRRWRWPSAGSRLRAGAEGGDLAPRGLPRDDRAGRLEAALGQDPVRQLLASAAAR